MSDYLSRMAEQAGSAPPIVRPALPSLFEPAKEGAALTGMPATQETEPIFGIEHDAEPTGETDTRSQSIHERVASIQSIWTTAVTSATPPQCEKATKQTSAGLVRVPVAEPAVRVFAAESSAVVEPSAESPHRQPAVWPRTAQPTALGQRQPIVEDAKPTSHPLVSAEPTPAKRRTAQSLATAAPVAPLLIPALAPVPRAPIASRERARAETAVVTHADSSPVPTIHVTIGRVEVRAILPAVQATQLSARSAPKLSLDDYLRARNGGAA